MADIEVAAAGGIGPLVRMLELPSSHPSAKHAVRALASLTASPEGADQAALRGAPGRLVKLIRDYGADEDTKLNAMTALGNLAAWEETTKDVEAAGGPRAIVRTLRESPASSPVAAEAARALANISLSGEDSPRIKHSNRSLSPPRTGYSSPASSSLKKRTASSSMKRVMAETRASTARRPLHLGPWIPPAQPNYLSRNTSPPPSPIPGRQTLNAYRTLSPGRTRARSTSPGRLRGELAIPGIVSGSLRATQALDTLRSSGELYPSPDSSLSIPEIVSMLGGSQQSAVRAASAFTNMSPTEAEKDHLCRLGGAEALVRLLDSGIDSQATTLAAAALSQLAYSHEPSCNDIRIAGGVERLASVLKMARRDSEAALWATCALTQLTYKNTVNCRVLLDAGAVPTLVSVVRSYNSAETRGNSLRVLCNVAHLPEACSSLRACGGIAVLVSELNAPALLSSTVVAARTLLNIACGDASGSSLREAGAVRPLVRLLDQDPHADIVMVSALALTQLALGSDLNCASIREAGAISRLLRLLRCGPDYEITRVAVGTLLNLANDARVCDEVRELGGIPELVRLLSAPPSSPAGPTLRLQAARVLANLALNKRNGDAIRIAGGIYPLVDLAREHPSTDVARVAAVALSQLVFDSYINQEAVRSAGGIPPLVKLLSPDYPETAKWAACAVAEMAFNNDGNCDAIRFAGGVRQLVMLLRTTVEWHITIQIVRALANLSLNHANQDEIRELGGIPYIIPLLKQAHDDNALMVGACALAELAFNNRVHFVSVSVISTRLLEVSGVLCGGRNTEIINIEGGLERLLDLIVSRPSSLVMAQAARAVAELCEHSHECRRKVSERYVAMDILRDVKRGTSVGSLEAAEQARRVVNSLDDWVNSPVPRPTTPMKTWDSESCPVCGWARSRTGFNCGCYDSPIKSPYSSPRY